MIHQKLGKSIHFFDICLGRRTRPREEEVGGHWPKLSECAAFAPRPHSFQRAYTVIFAPESS
jgi:hypothetical protein